MIYLIQEEMNIFSGISSTRTKILGYYECDHEVEVNAYCRAKTKELKGTYNEEKMDITIHYTELNKLD